MRCLEPLSQWRGEQAMRERHSPTPASVVHAADELLTHHGHASPMQLNIIVYSWTLSLDIDACGAVPELASQVA